jgi:hypothetical protein
MMHPTFARVLACLAGFALLAAACGDDSGGGTAAGSGGGGTAAGADSAGTGGGSGTGTTGGTSGGGSGTSGGGDPTACIAAGDAASAMGFMTRNAECKTCLCQKCKIEEVMACDDTCWGLISCAGEMCSGLPDMERTLCALMMCMEYIPAAAAATAIGNCAFPADGVDSCEDACRMMPDGGLPSPDGGM